MKLEKSKNTLQKLIHNFFSFLQVIDVVVNATHGRPIRLALRDAEGSQEVPRGPYIASWPEIHPGAVLSCAVSTTGRPVTTGLSPRPKSPNPPPPAPPHGLPRMSPPPRIATAHPHPPDQDRHPKDGQLSRRSGGRDGRTRTLPHRGREGHRPRCPWAEVRCRLGGIPGQHHPLRGVPHRPLPHPPGGRAVPGRGPGG